MATIYLSVLAAVSGLFFLGTLLTRVTTRKRCPRCKDSFSLDRVRRPALLKAVLFFLPTERYRCYSCRKDFLKIG